MLPRQLWLAAIFAAYLGYVAAHYILGQVPLWAYLALGNGIVGMAVAILRREQRRAPTRSAARPRGLRSSPVARG